ncbi:MAG: ParB/RepB/Spo0J family partition protein [Blastomonas sp.]
MADKDQNLAEAAKPVARKLGRGLSALLGEAVREEPLVQAETGTVSGNGSAVGVKILPLSDIRPHPGQPRRFFDEDALNELAASIASRGVIQPVIVRPRSQGAGYELVAGERRWRAAQRARLHEIPALVRDLSDEDTMALALIENIQREDLNPVEEAQAYQRLSDDQGYSQQDIARLVDKSRSHVANLMRLLALSDGVLKMVARGELSMGHARALINADDADDIARDIVDKGLSVREVEALLRKRRKGTSSSSGGKPGAAQGAGSDIAAVERHLEDLLGLKVRITVEADQRSGSVTVRYASLDQLDLICQRLSGEPI